MYHRHRAALPPVWRVSRFSKNNDSTLHTKSASSDLHFHKRKTICMLIQMSYLIQLILRWRLGFGALKGGL